VAQEWNLNSSPGRVYTPRGIGTAHAGLRRTGALRCLLDLDTDLADELEPEIRRPARAAATALTVEMAAGRAELDDWFAAVTNGPGLLLLDGVVAESVRVDERVTAELIGAGDLLQPAREGGADQLLSCETRWRALLPVRFALLDAGFAKRVRFWPQITHGLLRRAGRRVSNLNVQRAVAAQPRLEVRLALLLWHLAGRWGKVERGGIRLPLPLTHQLLGQLVGAERPSVSHALARLAQNGLVTGQGDEWHLHGSLEDQLPAMMADANGRAAQIVAAVASGGWHA
jgi:CRP/FNR family transcriptional regulator, cyclic AMP receptor protein